MHTLRRLIAISAATTGLLLAVGLAPATAAGPQPTRAYCLEQWNAIGCFQSDGDHFRVHDQKADGMRPEIHWETDYGREGICYFTGRADWTDCNDNFRERREVIFRLAQRDVSSGDIVYATRWVSAPTG
jgi:hypothetical protein